MGADKRASVGLAHPYHNPHLAEPVQAAAKALGWRFDYIAFVSLPDFRRENAWTESLPTHIPAARPSGWLACIRWIMGSDRYVFWGFGHPVPIQPALVFLACCTGRPVFVASEGLKKKPAIPLRLFCRLLSLFDNGQLLAIGNTAAQEFAQAGLSWPARRFGFTEKPPGAYVPKPAKVRSGPVRLLVVGQLIPRKRVDWLQIAISRHPARSRVELWVCGTGPEREKLEKQALSLGINARYMGFLRGQDLADAFNAADIFVHPAAYEGWGVVLNHALHFGLPILAYKDVRSAGGILVQEGVNGFVFGDEGEFSTMLGELADNPELRKNFAVNSRQLSDEWTVTAIGNRLGLALKDPESVFQPGKPLEFLVIKK